jgi:hypothetical protein
LIFLQIVVGPPVGTWMGSRHADELDGGDEADGAEAGDAESPSETGA